MNILKIYKSFCVIIIFSFFITFFNSTYAQTWNEPQSDPPGGNIALPLNQGITAQYKEGGLVIGGEDTTSLNTDIDDNSSTNTVFRVLGSGGFNQLSLIPGLSSFYAPSGSTMNLTGAMLNLFDNSRIDLQGDSYISGSNFTDNNNIYGRIHIDPATNETTSHTGVYSSSVVGNSLVGVTVRGIGIWGYASDPLGLAGRFDGKVRFNNTIVPPTKYVEIEDGHILAPFGFSTIIPDINYTTDEVYQDGKVVTEAVCFSDGIGGIDCTSQLVDPSIEGDYIFNQQTHPFFSDDTIYQSANIKIDGSISLIDGSISLDGPINLKSDISGSGSWSMHNSIGSGINDLVFTYNEDGTRSNDVLTVIGETQSNPNREKYTQTIKINALADGTVSNPRCLAVNTFGEIIAKTSDCALGSSSYIDIPCNVSSTEVNDPTNRLKFGNNTNTNAYLYSYDCVGNDTTFKIQGNGNIKIESRLTANQTTTERIQLKANAGNAQELLQVVNNSNGLNLFTILGSGNVGIGVDAPTQKLDVNGSIKVGGTTGGTIYLRTQTSDPSSVTGTGRLYNKNGILFWNGTQVGSSSGSGSDSGYWLLSGSNLYATTTIANLKVGIGTTFPDSTLSLQTTLGNAGLSIKSASAPKWKIFENSVDGTLKFNINHSDDNATMTGLSITKNRQVTINVIDGVPTAGTNLDVNGDVLVRGQLCIGSASTCIDESNFNKLQCPPRRVKVDEITVGWDEWAKYNNCDNSNLGYVLLSLPEICDGNEAASDCKYVLAVGSSGQNHQDCSRYCMEFGFQSGQAVGTITDNYDNNKYYTYVSGKWHETPSESAYWGAHKCKCFN